jgi:hypothetical protein
VLAFLGIAAVVCIVIAGFAILFTGRYPRGLFDFVLGVGRARAVLRVPPDYRPLPALLTARVGEA